ncbi:IS200/IS605 family transposase [Candidatus Woesearchaeota archaeon]|nr:IS200/IS605 family transposase [Candidatus Woesearchaeota archaeon]
MDVEYASHCSYRIRYHMVFVVKYRKKLLLERTRLEFLRAVMHGLSERYFFKFDAIGIDGDHFHVVVGAAPRYSPSEIMKTIKSWSARLIFQKYPYLRDELWGGEFWSDGGHIDTVSEYGGLEKIKKYVQDQGRNLHQLKLSKF